MVLSIITHSSGKLKKKGFKMTENETYNLGGRSTDEPIVYDGSALVCDEHGVRNDPDDVMFLPAPYAAQFNHCLDCAIRSQELKGLRGFTHHEIGKLIDEHPGNVWQIEKKAIKKLISHRSHLLSLQCFEEFTMEDPGWDDTPDVVHEFDDDGTVSDIDYFGDLLGE